MSGHEAPLRVGRIVALNMYPVYHQLERAALDGVVFTDGLPTALNAAVLDGRLDVSAIPSRWRSRSTPSRCSPGFRSSGCDGSR